MFFFETLNFLLSIIQIVKLTYRNIMSAVTVLGSAIRIVVKTLYVPSFDDSPACSDIERVLCRIERKCIVLGMSQMKQ